MTIQTMNDLKTILLNGFSYIEAFCAQKNIEILVINEEEPKSRDE